MEWNGVAWSRIEWMSRIEWNGVQWNRGDWSEVEWGTIE